MVLFFHIHIVHKLDEDLYGGHQLVVFNDCICEKITGKLMEINIDDKQLVIFNKSKASS